MILLDTDVVIDFLRGFPPALAWLATQGSQRLAIPAFVAMEVVQGCRDKATQLATEAELAHYDRLWPSAADCDAALMLLCQHRLVHGLGLLDALIAQTALSAGLPLHTFNVKHFGCIPGFVTVQPYAKS